jgi:glycogen synthase
MLGWEYPPHITGGLGTACEGLTRALAAEGVAIRFIVPSTWGDEDAPHMALQSAHAAASALPAPRPQRLTGKAPAPQFEFVRIDSVLQPYASPQAYTEVLRAQQRAGASNSRGPEATGPPRSAHYGKDLFAEITRFAREVGKGAAAADFDLIHAHDWMTFPAGLEARHHSGKPVILHVHSLEYDRSGDGGNSAILEIERKCLEAADHVIAVSYYTRSLIARIHGIPREKISVVHNGVTRAEGRQRYRVEGESGSDRKTVLFLGRITYQKGPEFFVRAAAKVAQREPRARFVMAGSGDLLPAMQQLVHELALDDRFEFPGFLRGRDVERAFTLADVFVMPSVSEPFGLVPLEAMACDTPVIVSRQSGVSEVLRHALKSDYWDVDRMAEQILAVLKHDALTNDMRRMFQQELTQLHWQAAAQKAAEIYREIATAAPA